MEYIIIDEHPIFGKGYFIGFKNGYAHFQSCNDRFTKCYKTRAGAEKQLERIKNIGIADPREKFYIAEKTT